MTREAIGLIFFAAVLIGKLIYDRHQHFSRKAINHNLEGGIVLALLIGDALFLGLTDWTVVFLYLGAFLFVFWAAMDFFFGLLIASNPFFLGSSAWLDRQQKKYPVLVWVKFGGAIVSLIGYGLSKAFNYIQL